MTRIWSLFGAGTRYWLCVLEDGRRAVVLPVTSRDCARALVPSGHMEIEAVPGNAARLVASWQRRAAESAEAAA